MKFENAELNTTFSIPEPLKVRHVLAYDSVVNIGEYRRPLYERLWYGVCEIAENWQSPVSLEVEALDNASSPEAINIVEWAGLALFSYITEQRRTPKN